MKFTRRYFCRTALLAGAVPASASLLDEVVARADSPRNDEVANSVLLTLLHTNDPHGHVYLPGDTIGLSRIATVVRQIRREMPNVLLLDAGDLIHGTPEEKAFEGKPILSAMNALGYDAATAGNHEFDFGQRITRQAIATAKFPVLSANIIDESTGRAWGGLKPYIIKEVQGKRIAIFGLTTPDTVRIQFPSTLKGIRFADPISTARTLVARLREQERADLVVFLSHLGYKPDLELAEAVAGIDIILGGHTHTRLPKQIWVNDTLIMQTGCFDRALGRVDVVVGRDAKGKPRININGQNGRWWGQNGVAAPQSKVYPTEPLVDMSPQIRHDATILAAYGPFRDAMSQRHSEVLTTAKEALPAEGAKEGETALGRLLAESIRHKFDVDVALFPSAAISNGLPAGEIRVGDVANIVGGYTRQHIVTARVPAIHLLALQKQAFKNGERLVQTAGLEISGTEVRIAGQPLRENAVYTVGAPAFVIQDTFLNREGVIVTGDDPEAPTTRETLVEFLRGHAPLTNAI